jgi:hypothetical protein
VAGTPAKIRQALPHSHPRSVPIGLDALLSNGVYR